MLRSFRRRRTTRHHTLCVIARRRLRAYALSDPGRARQPAPPPDPQPEVDERVVKARRRIATLGGIEARAAASADGDPVEALARYAESVDLLVVGSHAYRPTDSLLAGSTAQRLAGQAPCPLLVLARDGATAS